VTASATPTSGDLPLLVQFNATVVGGEAPLSFAWDFDGDGFPDSFAQNPVFIYNLPATYTAVVNVTDADGDSDTDSVVVTVSAATHDISVDSITHSKVGTTAYLWDLIDVTSDIHNWGSGAESVTVQLEVDGVVRNSATVPVANGVTVSVTLRYNATSADFNNVVMHALPVVGEGIFSNQVQSTSIRVWSVDDVVSPSTRTLFISTPTVIAGGNFTAFLPVQNRYAIQSFDDLRVELWSSNPAAFGVATPVQFIDLAGGDWKLVQWNVNALTPGSYVISAILGNNEIDSTEIASKTITVV